MIYEGGAVFPGVEARKVSAFRSSEVCTNFWGLLGPHWGMGVVKPASGVCTA